MVEVSYSAYSPEGTIESILRIEKLHRIKGSHLYEGCEKYPCPWCLFIREHCAYKMQELNMPKESKRRFVDLGYLCGVCAETKGGVWPKGHQATWHNDECKHCKNIKPLCHWTDFNWPNNLERNRRANLGESFGGREK